MRNWKRTIVGYAGVFFIYTLIMLMMTYPVVTRLGTHLVGAGDDMWVHYWNNWWVRKILAEGGDVYSTNLLFHPQTITLVYHNFGWLNIAGCLLVEPAVGPIVAYNLVYLVNLALCALAMFILGRYLLRSDGSAFIAGLVYGCWPYRLSDYEHPNLISTEWLPLVLLCVILVVRERGRIRHVLLTGLLVALTGFSRWQMLLPTAIAVGVYLLFSLCCERECWSWRVVGMLALAALFAITLISIPFYPLVRDLVTSGSSDHLYQDQEAEKQTDLLAYLVPPLNHPLAPLFDRLGYVHTWVRRRYSAFLGYSVLAMLVIALARRRELLRPWVALALVAFLLALGPVLRFDGSYYPAVPMPYRLLGWLAPFRWMRYPHRFNLLLALPVAVLAGYGAAVLQQRLARRRPVLLWIGLSVLVLFDYFNLPAATVRAVVPEFYVTLSREDGDFAVLDLPMGPDKGDYYMFYQTVHGHPIVEGNTARPQPYMFTFINESHLLRALREGDPPDLYPADISRQLAALADAGIRYVVVHKPFAQPEQLDDWRAFFQPFNGDLQSPSPLIPAHEDDEVLVYRTALEHGRDFECMAELADGVGLVSGMLSATALAQDGLLEADLCWGTWEAPTRDWAVRLALVSPAGEVMQAVDMELCAGWPTSEWGDNAVARGRVPLQVSPFLEGGAYTVTLTLVDRSDGVAAGEAATLGQVEVQAMARIFEVPEVTVPVQATFGDVLYLLGYDLEQGGESLQLTLHWQALRRMETAYKFFVHLYDIESGELVAQEDVMPHGWTYPTTWWEAGEVVSDGIRLSLEGVTPGVYRLVVGVYHSQTGDRLAVRDAEGQVERSGSLVMQEVAVP